MKIKSVLIVLFIMGVFISANGNTRLYCEELLDLAEKENINENYAASIKILGEIKKIASENNWEDLLFLAINMEGNAYMDISNYQKAIDCFLESYKIAMKNSNQKQEVIILNNIAQIYFIKDDLDKAKKYLKNAYDIAKQLKDTLKTGIIALNMGLVLNKTQEYTEAENYLEIAIVLSEKSKDTLNLLTSQLVKAENLFYRKEYEKSEQLAIQLLDTEYKERKAQVLLLLGKIQEQKRNFNKAIQYIQQALIIDTRLATKIEIYEYLSELYLRANQLVLSLTYKDSLLLAKDSLSKMNDLAQITNNQIEFDLINSEKELARNKAKQKTTRIFFISVFAFICLFVIIIIWMLQIQSAKNKQRKTIVELEIEKEKNEKLLLQQQIKEKENHTLLEQERLLNETNKKVLLEHQLKEQTNLILIKQEQLNNEINTKNRELASKVLLQSHRNSLIKEIIDTLSINSYNRIKENDLESMIQQLQLHLKESNEWESFLLYFEQINPAFLSSLKEKHPDLNAGEIRFLSYLYLDLNTTEIANLLSITEGHCRKRKLQIAHKLNIPVTELYQYIINEIRM
jgi:tetratricopeptide (TPR) repeat protein